ncbi:NlpC/P60 family protein [Streptomyces sp. NPDC008086]|uniref:C40 family peptidase n=1 Tax=Streptomyces sp. NPDC008086 TaxID=3364807 RepID=UPI0036E77499
MRNSALASAALTSVALLAQTANAAPSAADESPSREEVSRRVSSLYDQAESDTGTFNATRASATGPRGPADRPVGAGRGPAAARSDDSGGGDPALDSVARQWFDVARSKLGPIVPAVLPTGRTPARPTGTRAPRAADGLADRGREAAGRAALELPAAPVAELTSGPATGAAVAELTAGPVAALPAAPESPLETAGALQGTRSDQSALALPAPSGEPSAELQQRSALRTSKERNQRKLSQARELLSLHTARQSTSLTTMGALPAADTWSTTSPQAQPSADMQWDALRNQGPADLTTVPPGSTAWTPTPDPLTDPLVTTTPNQALATAQSYDPGQALETGQTDGTGQTYGTGRSHDTGQTYGTSPTYDTGQLPATSPAAALTATAPQDTRALRALDFARAQLGKPCVWGTSGPDAYDGPGLTQAAWKAAGISLPRTAPEQATAGQGITLTYLEPGDLVLFHVGHVGIYSGNGMMIHAPGPGAAIREESIHYAGESAIHSAIRPA